MLSSNPIWFREQQAWQARRQKVRWWRRIRYLGLPAVWLGMLVGTVCLSLMVGNKREPEWAEALITGAVAAMYVQVAYLAFRSVIAGASALTRERELQTMDTLLSSPLPTADLVVGKWMVAAVPLLIETMLVLPVAAVLTGLHPRSGWNGFGWWQAVDLAALSAGIVVFMTGLGILLSTRAVNSGKAATHAVLAGLALTLGTWLVDLMVEMFTRQDSLLPILCWLNPYTALWSILSAGERLSSGSHIFASFWGFTTVSYLLLAALAAMWSWQRLQRRANC